ncbi:MAG: diguanylate cyclase [Candidatus Eremiobacteraeota bacterium]|nr:diguanylate cyclase [Candidatus Eremiobacteraeota bacterium]
MKRTVSQPATTAADGSALERAQLVRSVAELLSTDAPTSEVWVRFCALLAALTHASEVTIAATDRLMYRYCEGVGTEPVDAQIRGDSLAAGVLVRDDTIVRANGEACETGVPVRFGRTPFGAICVQTSAALDAECLTLLESCALYLGARLYHESTVASTERYTRLAFTDGLTGIANRRQFDETIVSEWQRAARDGTPISALMLDLDYFKSYNDTYGHQSGDLCLQRVAHALHDCARRPADLIARYGGEEFVALLPGTDLEGAIVIAEEMCAAIGTLEIVHDGSSLGYVSLSAGAASVSPLASGTPEALLQAADDALYRAKLEGRNRVHAQGYHAGHPRVRARRASALSNLPVALTPLIGRQREISELCGLLERHRLVSIVGTGGTGKTRVAVAAATQVRGRFSDGAWFVDLSPITDPLLIASTVAAAFSAEVSIDESAADALAVILESKDALIVVDNCEHLIAEVANLSVALLRHCPKLSILATSREALSIPGESAYRLPLLAMPPADEMPDASSALEYDAIALFVERASEVKRDFSLDGDNVALVVEICRAVDGIALAIELAASRVGTIGLAQVAKHLREFRLLTGGDRTALPRQRTMHSMIGWSYDLLDERERILFSRLSIFAGSFTFDAVTEVCAGGSIGGEEVFDLLSGLIRKSLVVEDTGYESRYRLLDTVRTFARERLMDAGEAASMARWHADYFESLARQADSEFRRTPSRVWIEALAPDVDNFRAALDWSLDQRGDVVLGAALAAATINFFNDFMPSEATRWMRKALELLPRGAAPRVEARLCFGLATSSRNLPAAALRAAGERAIEISREINDRKGLAEALRGTAQIVGWYFREDRDVADRLALESIEIARGLDDPIQLALSLRTRGLTIDISDFAAKRAVLKESFALIRVHGNDRQIGSMLTWLSDLEFSAGDWQAAREYGREAVRFAENSGSNELLATTSYNLATYEIALGNIDSARRIALQAVRVARKTRHYEALTFTIQVFAVMAAELGDDERSARLLGWCDSRCGVLHPQRQADQSEEILYRRLCETLRERLGEEAFARARNAGANLNEEEAVRYAAEV